MNSVGQGSRKLSSDRHTYIQTDRDRQTDRQDQNYIPRRVVGGQQQAYNETHYTLIMQVLKCDQKPAYCVKCLNN